MYRKSVGSAMTALIGTSCMPPLVFILSAVAFLLVGSSAAASVPAPGLVFHVGGPRGWRVPDANTSYGWWAMNSRFHVGDALYFKYENDSVLVVDREDFDACNVTEPLAKFIDSSTTVLLDRPGFFCFISGEPGHCEEGQRLIVRVMVHPAEAAAAPGPALAPATSQPGHGGGGSGSGSGSGNHPGWPGTSSEATTVAAGVGVVFATAMVVLVDLQ